MILHPTTIADFEKESQGSLVLVDFFATWCGPCKMLSPVIEEIASEHPELKVLKLDIDEGENGQLAAKNGVSAVPTLLLYRDGKLVGTKVGYQPKPSLLSFLGF